MQLGLCCFRLGRQNTIDDYYSIFKYLRARPHCDSKHFKQTIGQKDAAAGMRILQVSSLQLIPYSALTLDIRLFYGASC